ncbi:hypothetical protein [Thermoanaerobacterium sp. PSU-2]|uniref:hypothetical protein n=1 Tax=Thermoanaerobacterium sp. PSU-2 TaxID=1930849 RepID=UPI001F0B0FB8|nr:hypothetical protein [Thermoanaerobacterium sp. PSU-2]
MEKNKEVNIETFKRYAEIFIDLYIKNIIIVKWFSEGVRIEAHDYNLKKELEAIDDKINLDDFIGQVFYILNEARRIVLKNDGTYDYDSEKIIIIKEILQRCPQLIDDIKVKCTSKQNLFDNFDYEILTKRNKNDINEILTYSILINLELFNDDSKNKGNHKILFELAETDVENMIKVLQEALEKLQILKKIEEKDV